MLAALQHPARFTRLLVEVLMADDAGFWEAACTRLLLKQRRDPPAHIGRFLKPPIERQVIVPMRQDQHPVRKLGVLVLLVQHKCRRLLEHGGAARAVVLRPCHVRQRFVADRSWPCGQRLLKVSACSGEVFALRSGVAKVGQPEGFVESLLGRTWNQARTYIDAIFVWIYIYGIYMVLFVCLFLFCFRTV